MTGGITLASPWLTLDLDGEHRVLSWAVHRPGFVTARHITWREVRNADLPADLDPVAWLQGELRANGFNDHVCFLTSRDVAAVETSTVTVEGITATCVATVGLSNAENIGTRYDRSHVNWGTINIACKVDTGLTDIALIEALSLVTEARTAAISDIGYSLPTGTATGTGTDCIAVAAPPGSGLYAGKHTALGEAIGRSVREAVHKGADVWMNKVRRDVT